VNIEQNIDISVEQPGFVLDAAYSKKRSFQIERLWHATVNQKPWHTLAVVGLAYSEELGAFLKSLASLAQESSKEKVCLLHGSKHMLPMGVSPHMYDVVYADAVADSDAHLCLRECPVVSLDMKHGMGQYGKKIYFFDSIHTRPSVLPLLQKVDLLLLAVHLQEDSIEDVETVVDMLGKERILGVVTFGKNQTLQQYKA
jgi:hypothetical protein